MANTDLALSPCETQSQSHSPAGRCGPSPKPSHFLTGVYSSTSVPGAVSGPVPVAGPSPVSVAAASSRQAHSQSPSTALEQYRLQLYNYALNIERLRCPQYGSASASATASASGWLHPYSPLHCAGSGVGGSRLAISLFPQSQRIFQPEEPKPQHSYIGLIAMAILSSAEIKLVLSDIYQYILDNYPYFRTRGPGWRNSIRHNLSLNDCFIKSGRSANGKGHYWAIHPANMDDFRKGDFRRRKAQRKVRKHMGLSVDDASTDSPSPPPLDLTTPPPPLGTAQASLQLAALNYPYHQHYIGQFFGRSLPTATATATAPQQRPAESQMEPIYPQYPQHHPHYQQQQHHHHHHQHIAYINSTTTTTIANLYSQTRKRQFDVASLLAPDVQIVDIVADEAKTQHTLITKVQVQKHELELVVEQSRSRERERDETEADIDVDGDGDGERDGDRDGDSDREADDARRLSFDAEHNGSASASASISPVPSSSQHDSNSLEECPTAQASADTQLTSTTLPLAMPKSYDPHLLSRYYGSYMAAAARRASIEANRVVQANKSMTTPPPKELLPNKL
ncbi:hypothetical protein ACLKA6_001462 [Drosophila palustris]